MGSRGATSIVSTPITIGAMGCVSRTPVIGDRTASGSTINSPVSVLATEAATKGDVIGPSAIGAPGRTSRTGVSGGRSVMLVMPVTSTTGASGALVPPPPRSRPGRPGRPLVVGASVVATMGSVGSGKPVSGTIGFIGIFGLLHRPWKVVKFVEDALAGARHARPVA